MVIEWSPLAVERVIELAEFIALDKPDAAIQWANKIFDSTEKLKEHPMLGRKFPEVNEDEFRELLEGNYRVIYWLGDSKISVLTVCHGSRLLPMNDVK